MHGSHPISQRRHRRWPVVVAAVVVVLVAGAVGFRAWLTQAPSRVTVDQALDRYRSTASNSSTASTPAASLPAPGVYVYGGSGHESVDALGGDTHTYPTPTTITVTMTSCGYRMTWMPLSGRTDVTDVCRTGEGFSVTSVVNSHEFFHISQDEHFVYDPGFWWLPPNGTTTWTGTAHSEERTLVRTAKVMGTENVVVGTDTVAAVHVHIDDAVSGASAGWTSIDLWVDPSTGLPVREMSSSQTGNDTPIGHVTFDETIDLTLTSLTPAR